MKWNASPEKKEEIKNHPGKAVETTTDRYGTRLASELTWKVLEVFWSTCGICMNNFLPYYFIKHESRDDKFLLLCGWRTLNTSLRRCRYVRWNDTKTNLAENRRDRIYLFNSKQDSLFAVVKGVINLRVPQKEGRIFWQRKIVSFSKTSFLQRINHHFI